MKKLRGVGGKGDERTMVVSSPIYPPPASGSPMGAVLRDRTTRRPYPDADKGTQVPRICQRWTQK
jgi:hypothetical protein